MPPVSVSGFKTKNIYERAVLPTIVVYTYRVGSIVEHSCCGC